MPIKNEVIIRNSVAPVTYGGTEYRKEIVNNTTTLKEVVGSTTVAKEIVEKIYDSEILSGRNPSTICGVSVYLACQLLNIDKKKKEISEGLHISESSISNSLSKLKDFKDTIFDEKDKEKVELIQW